MLYTVKTTGVYVPATLKGPSTVATIGDVINLSPEQAQGYDDSQIELYVEPTTEDTEAPQLVDDVVTPVETPVVAPKASTPKKKKNTILSRAKKIFIKK